MIDELSNEFVIFYYIISDLVFLVAQALYFSSSFFFSSYFFLNCNKQFLLSIIYLQLSINSPSSLHPSFTSSPLPTLSSLFPSFAVPYSVPEPSSPTPQFFYPYLPIFLSKHTHTPFWVDIHIGTTCACAILEEHNKYNSNT